ncbi:MAG: Tad domain-containing protein [Verrucomicrobiia bacterium]
MKKEAGRVGVEEKQPGPECRRSRRERGSALVLVVLGMLVVLLIAAFAVDHGVLVLEANRLQRACDAGALAGAIHLSGLSQTPTSADLAVARQRAVSTAAANQVVILPDNVVFLNGNTRVRVTGSKQVPLFFGQLASGSSAAIHRRATAEVSRIRGLGGVLPLGLTVGDYARFGPGGPNANEAFTVELIRNQDTAFDNGNVVGLSLQLGTNGKSPAQWENELAGVSDMGTGSRDQMAELNSINSSLQPQGRILRDTLGARFDGGDRSFEVFLLNPKPQTNGNSPHPIQDVARIEMVERPTQTGKNGARMRIRFLPPSSIDASNREVILAQPGESSFSATILRLVDDL